MASDHIAIIIHSFENVLRCLPLENNLLQNTYLLLFGYYSGYSDRHNKFQRL